MANEPVDVFQNITMRGKDECWPWKGGWGGREGQRRPYFSAHRRRTMAYRWVWELVHGSLDPEKLILHSCDNGAYPIGCCNPHHMRLGSHDENMDDMKARGRHGLPATAVQAIRRLLDQGTTQQEVADRYGVSRETISAIATGRVYSHVPEVPPSDPTQDERQS